MSPWVVEPATWAEVAHLRQRLAKEGVSMSPGNTRWWVVRRDGAILGVAGLLDLRGGAVRLKAAWVEPAYRGQGVGDALLRHRLQVAEEECRPWVEVYAYRPGTFRALGFRDFGELGNGAVKLRKVL